MAANNSIKPTPRHGGLAVLRNSIFAFRDYLVPLALLARFGKYHVPLTFRTKHSPRVVSVPPPYLKTIIVQ